MVVDHLSVAVPPAGVSKRCAHPNRSERLASLSPTFRDQLGSALTDWAIW